MLARNFTRWGAITVLLALATIALANPAVGILYQRSVNGNLESVCTVSVVAGADVGVDADVALITAAHCVDRNLVYDDVAEEWRDNADWLVTFDETAFAGAITHRVGILSRGYDVAVMLFAGALPDVTPLRFGDWATVQLGSRLLNWANPMGIGVQRFEGYVSMLSLERPVRGANIWWRHHGVAIIPGAGGSSGSLLLDDDGLVVGVLIGVIQASMGTPFIVFVPLNRVQAFLTNDAFARVITR